MIRFRLALYLVGYFMYFSYVFSSSSSSSSSSAAAAAAAAAVYFLYIFDSKITVRFLRVSACTVSNYSFGTQEGGK